MARKKAAQAIAPVEDESLIRRVLVAFEQAKRFDKNGREYWFAREYMHILGYTNWRNFNSLINRAKATVEQEGGVVGDHFDTGIKVIQGGKGAQQEIPDFRLTRRACYLISINGDPTQKPSIAAAQQYFVEQARKQEIHESLLEAAGADIGRLAVRDKLSEKEQEFNDTITPRLPVPDLHKLHKRQIREAGHEALFNRSTAQIREHLQVSEDENVMDVADPLIVQGSAFATAVATRRVQDDPKLRGVNKIKKVKEDANKGVRGVMTDAAYFPETVAPVEHIKAIEDRLGKQKAKLERRNGELPDA